jgi:hypothetical protein
MKTLINIINIIRKWFLGINNTPELEQTEIRIYAKGEPLPYDEGSIIDVECEVLQVLTDKFFKS